MKRVFCLVAIGLTAMMIASCATSPTPETQGERLRAWDYDIHTYQPPCQVTTTKHASGTILGQSTYCPPPQFYCTLSSTGTRIPCPKFNMENFKEDFSAVEDMHFKKDCQLVGDYNRTQPKNNWMMLVSPEDNPYCNEYGEPK